MSTLLASQAHYTGNTGQAKKVLLSLPPRFGDKYKPNFEKCSTEYWNMKNEKLPEKQTSLAVYSRFWLR